MWLRCGTLLLEWPLKTCDHSDVWLVLQCRAQLRAPMLMKECLPPMVRSQLRDQNSDDLLRSFLVQCLQMRQHGLDEGPVRRFQYGQRSALAPPLPLPLNGFRAGGIQVDMHGADVVTQLAGVSRHVCDVPVQLRDDHYYNMVTRP